MKNFFSYSLFLAMIAISSVSYAQGMGGLQGGGTGTEPGGGGGGGDLNITQENLTLDARVSGKTRLVDTLSWPVPKEWTDSDLAFGTVSENSLVRSTKEPIGHTWGVQKSKVTKNGLQLNAKPKAAPAGRAGFSSIHGELGGLVDISLDFQNEASCEAKSEGVLYYELRSDNLHAAPPNLKGTAKFDFEVFLPDMKHLDALFYEQRIDAGESWIKVTYRPDLDGFLIEGFLLHETENGTNAPEEIYEVQEHSMPLFFSAEETFALQSDIVLVQQIQRIKYSTAAAYEIALLSFHDNPSLRVDWSAADLSATK